MYKCKLREVNNHANAVTVASTAGGDKPSSLCIGAFQGLIGEIHARSCDATQSFLYCIAVS